MATSNTIQTVEDCILKRNGKTFYSPSPGPGRDFRDRPSKHVQDLNDTASVFGSTLKNFETLNSKITKRFMVTTDPESIKKSQVSEELAHMIYANFKINDVQHRATGLNHLLNIELRSDSGRSLKQFGIFCVFGTMTCLPRFWVIGTSCHPSLFRSLTHMFFDVGRRMLNFVLESIQFFNDINRLIVKMSCLST